MATIVQTKLAPYRGATNDGTTRVLTFDSPVTAGNSILVFAFKRSATWNACSDNIDGAYTVIRTVKDIASSASAFAQNNVTGGTTTITVSASPALTENSQSYAVAIELSGVDTTNFVAASDDAFTLAANGTDSINSGSVTTTTANQLVFAGCFNGDAADAGVVTAGTGMTELTNASTAAAGAGMIEYILQGTAGAVSPKFTHNQSYNWQGIVVSIKNGAGAVKTATVSAITGGENLTPLDYAVFAGHDISTMTILQQGSGETTDELGNLAIDLSGTAAANNDPVTIIIGDWTTAPTGTSKAAVCYTTVSVT